MWFRSAIVDLPKIAGILRNWTDSQLSAVEVTMARFKLTPVIHEGLNVGHC
jgi:hypothetical protein